MRRLPVPASIAVLCACIAGCAAPVERVAPNAAVTDRRSTAIAPARVSSIVPGSSKTDVLAALGETLAIRFDSGYEVWVYRLAGEAASRKAQARARGKTPAFDVTGEFVLLFDPSGTLAKTRVRHVPPGQPPAPATASARPD